VQIPEVPRQWQSVVVWWCGVETPLAPIRHSNTRLRKEMAGVLDHAQQRYNFWRALVEPADVQTLRDFEAKRVLAVGVCGARGVGKTAAIDAFLAVS
jgi:hypothetical protein